MKASTMRGAFGTSGAAPRGAAPSITTTPMDTSSAAPPSASSSHVPLHNIEDPTSNDVLSGRGVTTNKHPGNVNFRSLVALNKELYVTSTKKQKMSISRSIVEAVRSMSPPGRFLDKDPVTGLWSDIGDRKAIEKTSQALRDGAANLRKQLSADLGDPDFLSAVFEVDNSASKNGNNSASLKDKNKPTKTKSVKKGHRRTKSNPNTMQEKKVLVKKKPRGEVLAAEQYQRRHSAHHHPESPATMSRFRSLSGSPLVNRTTSLGRATSFEYERHRSYQRSKTPSPSPPSPHQMHPRQAAAAAAYHYQQAQQARQSPGSSRGGYPVKAASFDSWMAYPAGHPYARSPPPPPPGHPQLTHPSGYRSPTGAADVPQAYSPASSTSAGSSSQRHASLSPSQERQHQALSPNSQQSHAAAAAAAHAAHYGAQYPHHQGQYLQHASPHAAQYYPQQHHRPPVSPSMNRPWSPRSFAAASVASPPQQQQQQQQQYAAWPRQGQSPTTFPAYSNGDLNVPNLNTSRTGVAYPSTSPTGSYRSNQSSPTGGMPPRVIRSASADDFAPPISPTSSWSRQYPPERRTMSPREIPDKRQEEDQEEQAAVKSAKTSTTAATSSKATPSETMSSSGISSKDSCSDISLNERSLPSTPTKSTATMKRSSSTSSSNTNAKGSSGCGYRTPTIVVSNAMDDEKMNSESPGKCDIEVVLARDEGRDGEDTFMSDSTRGSDYGGRNQNDANARADPAADDDNGNQSDISVGDDSLAPLPFEPDDTANRPPSPRFGCQSTRNFLDMIPESLLQMPIAPCGPQDEEA